MSKNKLSHNAVKLIEMLQSKRVEAEDLIPRQRKIIVKYFMENMDEMTNAAIGSLIGVTDVHVSRIKREMLKKGVWEIEQIDIKMLALRLKQRKEMYQRRAIEIQDYALAWKIEMDYIGKMQDMGFVYKAPDKHLVATYENEWELRMKEFLYECGSSTPREFFDQLRELQEGNGRKLLEPPHS